MSHGDVAFDTGSRSTVETITRHRCLLPRVTRRRRLGRCIRCAECCTVYRFECTRFGLGWWPVSSVDNIVRDRRVQLSDVASIGLAP